MTTEETTPKKTKNPKREYLIAMSNLAKQLRDDMAEAAETAEEALMWSSRTINYMLLNYMYVTDGAIEFNTFKQWKERGATIKKGSKAFLVWGQPVGRQKAEEAKAKGDPTQEDDSDYDYFPMCFLFSDKQVITAEEMEEEKQRKESERKEKEQREAKIKSLKPVEID